MFFNSKTHIAHLFCFLVTGKTVDDKYDFHVKKISGLIMVCFRSEQHTNTNYFLISVAVEQLLLKAHMQIQDPNFEIFYLQLILGNKSFIYK
jgi:hypothetical protein